MVPVKKPVKKAAAKKPDQPSQRLRPAGKKAAKPAETKAVVKGKTAKDTKKTLKTAKTTVVETPHSSTKLTTGGAPHVKPSASHTPSKKESGPKLSVIRIRLSAFDHTVLDEAAGKIVETAERTGAVIHGPIPLPTQIRKWTVNRSTFVHKDARDQFEMRTHRRLIDLRETTFKTVESLQSLSLPGGVDIEIKMG